MNCRVIRDREAPGSNPGPPTKFCIQNRRFLASYRADGAQPGHRFAGNYRYSRVQW